MTADEFRAALEHFGLSERAASRLFGVPSRSILKMASGGRYHVMPSIAAEIERMYRGRLTRVQVAQMVRAKTFPGIEPE